MIRDIKELNGKFPEYATLEQATVTVQDMGEKTITSQVMIDGQIAPDFSSDWEVEFKGNKYIMPLRKPQGAKESTSLYSTIDLTFQHWAVYQLKRWYFFTVQPVASGTAVPDQYMASVSLNLKDFCGLFGQVLNYYYGNKITIDFNDPATHENGWSYKSEPTNVEISNSYIWDVLIKFHELFGVRWTIEPRADNNNEVDGGEKYVIKVGYPTSEINHIFEYGFAGGLMRVERQVQDENIRNMIIGRGGSKNLPYRYFKDVDPQNDSFSADPDWVPELANIYFSELRGATFRSYVQGWKTRHYGGATVTGGDYAYAPWAWWRGYTDSLFRPIEYVADRYEDARSGYTVASGSSIDRYGELMGGLQANSEIHPTIQGVELDRIGRADEVVFVEQVESDDIEVAVKSDAKIVDVGKVVVSVTVEANKEVIVEKFGGNFDIPDGMYGNLDEGEKVIELTKKGTRVYITRENGRWTIGTETVEIDVENLGNVTITDASISVFDRDTKNERSASGIPAGKYTYRLQFRVKNNTKERLTTTISCEKVRLMYASVDEQWAGTFDIWVKNIWESQKLVSESPEAYTERVWRSILGDREGGEAKVVFSDGMLSTSKDYEFTIVKGGIAYDTSQSIPIKDAQGNVTGTVQSEWRLTLAKSDADLESTGLYVPSKRRNGNAGDHFFFTGIDLPHKYVVWAEERLDDWKKDELAKVSDIRPTWVVKTDRVRLNNDGNAGALIWQIQPGNTVKLADKRFISDAYETQYIQSVTYTFRKPTNEDAAINPDVEIILSDGYETSGTAVATLQGEVSSISRQIGSLSNLVQLVRAVGDKIYLRKDGFSERSLSPTEFASLLTSDDFRKGLVGGSGWGFFQDETGAWVLEADRINARRELSANTMVINQIETRNGTIIESAARMEVTRVVETDNSYVCYFDQRGGSVANMFHVDDVAYCNRYTPDNGALKYYQRRVTEVTQTSVTLTKGYEPVEMPDGTTDTGVDGDGIPEVGDIIAHYGNYTDANRTYVKVRDVVGGGYERYIEGLDRVGASGTEYYFVGRQIGMYGGKPRFFIGAEEEFAEWKEGKLNVSGQVHVSKGSTGAGNFSDLPEEISKAVVVGGENLLRNTGFDGEYKSLDMAAAGTLTKDTMMYGDPMEHWDGSGKSVEEPDAVSGHSCDIKDRYISQDVDLIAGENYVVSFKAVGTLYIGCGGAGEFSSPENGEETATRRVVKFPNVAGGRTHFKFVGDNPNSKQIFLYDLKLERGTVATDWCPAREDTDPVALRFKSYDYLRQAFTDGGTDILNGIVLTSIINLGNPEGGKVADVTAGASGIRSTDEDIAFWAGGSLADAIRTRSRVSSGVTMTDEEWNQLIGFCVTHGGDAFFKGFVYALGGVFRGRVEAEDGYFKGKILAKDGYFSGFVYKGFLTITPENFMDYVTVTDGIIYEFLWGKISPIVEFRGDFSFIQLSPQLTFKGFNNLTQYTPSQETIDAARQLVGSDMLIYNRSENLVPIITGVTTLDDSSPAGMSFQSTTVGANHCAHLVCKCAFIPKSGSTDESEECVYWLVRSGHIYNQS